MDLSTIMIAIPIFAAVYGAVDLLMDSRRQRSSSALRRLQGNNVAQPTAVHEMSQTIGRLAFNRIFLSIGGFRRYIENLLLKNGYPFGWNPESVLVYKEVITLVVIGILWFGDIHDVASLCIGAFIGFFLLDIFLSLRGSARRTQMQRELPGYVDLLALTTESGLDLLAATERIGERMKAGPLHEEIDRMIQESRLGTPRREVLVRWARRTGLSDAQSLASLINQSDEMGTPLATVLRSYSEDMRNRRVLRAEEMAGKIPVKILFPMLVFFFPIIFVIILGPVVSQFIDK